MKKPDVPSSPPQILRDIERDVGRDLRKVGKLARSMLGLTERAERALQELARDDDVRGLPPAPIGRIAGTEVYPRCPVCNDKGEVGEQQKVPCPACRRKK